MFGGVVFLRPQGRNAKSVSIEELLPPDSRLDLKSEREQSLPLPLPLDPMCLLLIRRYRTQIEAGVFAETVVWWSRRWIRQGCIRTSSFKRGKVSDQMIKRLM